MCLCAIFATEQTTSDFSCIMDTQIIRSGLDPLVADCKLLGSRSSSCQWLRLGADQDSAVDSGPLRPGCCETGNIKKALKKIQNQADYRRRFLLTCSLCWSYVMMGWLTLQVGPALPDLQTLIKADLEASSWIFTCWSLGFIIGSFLSGLLYDRCSRLWLTLATTVGAGVCTLMTPYMTSLTGMLALRVASGLFCGALDTGANTIVSSIWESDSGPYMQALYLSYTVGGIVAPFVTRPFMSSENEKHTGGHLNGDEKGIDDHTRVVSLTNSQLTSNNYSNISQRLYSRFESEAMNISQFSQESSMLFERTSQIHYAFIVTGVLAFMSSFPYLAMIVSGRFSSKSKPRRCEITVSGDQESLTDDSLTHTESRDVTLKRPDHRNKCLLLVCLAAINILYNAVEDSFGDFVITFCLEYLQWSNTQSVALLSLYWLASCIGGLTGILLVRVIGSGRLLAVMHVGWILTFGLSSLGSVFRIHALIWFSMPASGFFMVQIIPAVFSWTAENVCPVTGKVSSLFLIATGVGIAGNPSVIGYLMERFTFVSFVYVLTGEAILCAVCNFLALLIASRQSSGRGPYPPTKA